MYSIKCFYLGQVRTFLKAFLPLSPGLHRTDEELGDLTHRVQF